MFASFLPSWNILRTTKWQKPMNYMCLDSVSECMCVFVLQSDSRLAFQLPVLGVFSCRLCRARSVHFISCSFTDSVEPPLSCSASGSSLWQRTGETRCHEIEKQYSLLYIYGIMVSREKHNIWGKQKIIFKLTKTGILFSVRCLGRNSWFVIETTTKHAHNLIYNHDRKNRNVLAFDSMMGHICKSGSYKSM